MINSRLKSLGLMTLTCAALSGCGEGMPEELAPELATAEQGVGIGGIDFDEIFEKIRQQQARRNSYLSQAGFINPGELGTTKEILGCETSSYQGAGTFNQGIPNECFYQATEPGWVIQSSRLEVVKNRNGRGRYSQNTIAENGQFNLDMKVIGDKWKAAIELAEKAGDSEMKGRLELEYQQHMERVVAVSANKNTTYLTVVANGGLFEKSEIHVKLYVTLIRVQ